MMNPNQKKIKRLRQFHNDYKEQIEKYNVANVAAASDYTNGSGTWILFRDSSDLEKAKQDNPFPQQVYGYVYLELAIPCPALATFLWTDRWPAPGATE